MVLSKFKSLFNQTTSNVIDKTSKHSINHLIKLIVSDPTNADQKLFLQARLIYLSKYHYPKNIGQGGRIMLNNMNLTEPKTTIHQVLHLIYHTLDQESRFQVIPDLDIFNFREHKYGDLVNVNTERAIELKTWENLSQSNLTSVKKQYQYNKRNKEFIFSIFYKNAYMNESLAKEFLLTELNLEPNQLVIKSLDSISESFSESNIEKAISYYNISWAEYQIEINVRLYSYLSSLLQNTSLTLIQRRKITRFLKEMSGGIGLNAIERRSMLKNPKYKFKNSELLPTTTNIDPIDDDVLTPEDFMEDACHWMFNEEE